MRFANELRAARRQHFERRLTEIGFALKKKDPVGVGRLTLTLLELLSEV